MNTLHATLQSDGGHIPAVHQGTGVRLDLSGYDFSSAPGSGQRVIVGLRPEHFTLASNGGALPVNVAVVEPTGAEILVVCRVAGTEIQTAFKERHDFKPGQRIMLEPMRENVHLFEVASGQRLP